jgi:hypothetical protein
MPIYFSLTSYQRHLQRLAREFANEILRPLVRAADEDSDPQKALPTCWSQFSCSWCHASEFAVLGAKSTCRMNP